LTYPSTGNVKWTCIYLLVKKMKKLVVASEAMMLMNRADADSF